jgi:hypothetical protein
MPAKPALDPLPGRAWSAGHEKGRRPWPQESILDGWGAIDARRSPLRIAAEMGWSDRIYCVIIGV